MNIGKTFYAPNRPRRRGSALLRLDIRWIVAGRHRPVAFNQRLNYFLKLTKQNTRFGMVQ